MASWTPKLPDLIERHGLHDVEGDIAELGVHKGASAAHICAAFPGVTLHAFDTFRGIPEGMEQKIDNHKAGDFSDTSLEKAQETLQGLPVKFHVGVIPESLAECGCDKFRFAHVDVDLYASTKAAIEWLWPRMAPGGVIVDDDYGYSRCKGAKLAVDEFVNAMRVQLQHLGESCYIVKPPGGAA